MLPRLIALLIAALLCASCATMTTSMKNAAQREDLWGPPPENLDAIVQDAAARWFKDPESVQQVRAFKPRKESVYLPRFYGTPPQAWFGWVIPFEANAKNSLGGYTGVTPHKVYWRDGFTYDVRRDIGVIRDEPDQFKPVGLSRDNYFTWRDGRWVPPS